MLVFKYGFRKKYVEDSLKKRKGKCRHCGCCRFMFLKCDHQDGIDCKRMENQPYICQTYPFDEKDKYPFSKKICGHFWD